MAGMESVPPLLLTKRWLLAYVGFYGYFCQFLHRVNLSMAIVCMVKTTLPNVTMITSIAHHSGVIGKDVLDNTTSSINRSYAIIDQHTDEVPQCGLLMKESQIENERAEFNWDKPLVSNLLSTYFYGLIVTQVLGGWFAIRFGAKRTVTVSMTIQAVCSILTPELTRVSFIFLIVLRVVTGLVSGPVSAAFFTIWTNWAPPGERGRLLNLTFLGGIVGSIVSFSTSGFLCAYGFDNGWGSIFYTHGFLTLIYVVVWLLVVSETPQEHPSITEGEKRYIIESTAGSVAPIEKDSSIPWKSILTSPAVFVLIFTHICFNWSNYVILNTLPLYMEEVLQFDNEQNGLLTSLIQTCRVPTAFLIGFVSDRVINRGYISTTAARRVFQGTSFIGLSACLFIVTFCDCSLKVLAVVMLCVGLTFMGVSQAGYYLNVVDLAPRYSGVIYGLSNALSCTTGIFGPIIVGLLTVNGTQSEWNNVFYVCITVSVAGTLVFCTMSRGEVQPWAEDATIVGLNVPAPGEESLRHSNRQSTAIKYGALQDTENSS